MRENRRDVTGREFFKKEVDKKGNEMYADVGSEESGFGREEIVEGVKMRVKIGRKVLVCGDQVGKKEFSVHADDT